MYSICKLCSQSSCKGCLVPYSDDTVESMLDKLGLVRNETLFGNRYYAGKELVCNITWHNSIANNLFDFMATAQAGSKLPDAQTEADDEFGDGCVNLKNCFSEFKQSEILDEDNKWYCNKC